MTTIAEQIKGGRVLISDGAWGTFLQQKGLHPGECPELWNLDRPDDVLDIAKSYIQAGSDTALVQTLLSCRFMAWKQRFTKLIMPPLLSHEEQPVLHVMLWGQLALRVKLL
jgi:methionine synthase I (cobalamin-dependent)